MSAVSDATLVMINLNPTHFFVVKTSQRGGGLNPPTHLKENIMGQKRVSFKVAKAIKEAGYNEPCDMYYHIYDDEYESEMSLEATGDGSHSFLNSLNHYRCAAPSALDVWLWLWREKDIKIVVSPNCLCIWIGLKYVNLDSKLTNDPKEAIITAIEYIVDNNLIK